MGERKLKGSLTPFRNFDILAFLSLSAEGFYALGHLPRQVFCVWLLVDDG